MSNIYVELLVTSKKTNLQELSKITGLSSIGGHNINDELRKGYPIDYCLWRYKTEKYKAYYTEDVSPQLIKTFKDSMDEFADFIQKNCCEVSICFVITDVTDKMPGLTIDREMVNFATKLNAKISFDGCNIIHYDNYGLPKCKEIEDTQRS